MEDLERLTTSDIIIGREKLVNNSLNLCEIAAKSEEAFKQATSKDSEKAVLEQTRNCVTHALASVAQQISNLACDLNTLIEGEINEMKVLQYEVSQLEMKGRAFESKRDMKRLSRFISFKFRDGQKRKTKRCRRARHSKHKYISTEINYGALDKVGHGMIFTLPKTCEFDTKQILPPPSPKSQVNKHKDRCSIASLVWESPFGIATSPSKNDGPIYDFKVANTQSNIPSLGDGESFYNDTSPVSSASSSLRLRHRENIYSDMSPVSSASSSLRLRHGENIYSDVYSVPSSSSSLRLRRESDISDIRTPTRISTFFMSIKSNECEYATFDDYRQEESKGTKNAPSLARPINDSNHPMVDTNEPLYDVPPTETDFEIAFRELDDATNVNAYIFDSEEARTNSNEIQPTNVPAIPPPTNDTYANADYNVTGTSDREVTRDNSDVIQPTYDMAIPLPTSDYANADFLSRTLDSGDTQDHSGAINQANTPAIPHPPPFKLNKIDKPSSPRIQPVTPKIPEQVDRSSPCEQFGLLSSELVKEMRGKLKPTNPQLKPINPKLNPTNPQKSIQSPCVDEDAIGDIAAQLSALTFIGQQGLGGKSEPALPSISPVAQPQSIIGDQLPVVPRKPPPTKPRPKSEVPRPILESDQLPVVPRKKPPPVKPKTRPISEVPCPISESDQLPVVTNRKKPPPIKPKTRPISEVPRPISETNASISSGQTWPPNAVTPLPAPVNNMPKKTPPPPPPRPKPGKLQKRYSTRN